MAYTPIHTLMERDVAIIGYGAPLEAVARELHQSSADAAVVVHDDGKLVGLLTEREIVFGAEAISVGINDRAGEFANPRFVSVREDAHANDVFAKLLARRARRAVVLDEEGAVVGLVSLEAANRIRDVAEEHHPSTA